MSKFKSPNRFEHIETTGPEGEAWDLVAEERKRLALVAGQLQGVAKMCRDEWGMAIEKNGLMDPLRNGYKGKARAHCTWKKWREIERQCEMLGQVLRGDA